MRKHTKVYMQYFGYSIGDFIPSELTGNPCVDVNHIDARGMGGTKKEDKIENLIGLTRDEHLYFGDRKDLKPFLKEAHESFMKTRTPWIELYPNCNVLHRFFNRT